MSSEEHNSALFANLVMTFYSAGMQHLGKLKNPLTDKVEQDLEQAQQMIDMLEMLAVKTKGNLTDEEKRMMTTAAHDLKLNYVDEVGKKQQPGV